MLVLLKTTNFCNLNCRYCSGSCGEEKRRDLVEHDCVMLVEQLPDLLRDGEPVRFLWHGGEPTLLHPDKFKSMQEILANVADSGHLVTYSMQTNGYCISDEWLDVLEEYRVGVGVSLDGPSFLHDEMRISHGGVGTYKKIVENIKKIKKNDISISLLCTLRKKHMNREPEILDWLEEMNLPIRFNPLLNLGRSKEELSLQDYYNFLRNIMMITLERGIAISIEPLEWMLSSVIGDLSPRECSYSGRCGVSIFSYGPGGDVGICNRDDKVYGNLTEQSLKDLYESAQWKMQRMREERMKGVCNDCEIWTYCHGGCASVEKDAPNKEHCKARREFFRWLQTKGLELYKAALVRQRLNIKNQLKSINEFRQIFI